MRNPFGCDESALLAFSGVALDRVVAARAVAAWAVDAGDLVLLLDMLGLLPVASVEWKAERPRCRSRSPT
ncbi:hypothetical protein ACFV9E_23095 [Streptomyces sp. NPDC059835]|uniref:hypothetical protein n=1 Tax=Streptomyces sp. NPDC059835 TaxID=3346967 RepID=UPI0036571DFB